MANVTDAIGPAIHGLDATDQPQIDQILLDLDATPNKGRLGANTILAVSLAMQVYVLRTSFETLLCESLLCFQTGGPGETFFCEREAHNPHSKVAIMVKLDVDGSVIGHIPNGSPTSSTTQTLNHCKLKAPTNSNNTNKTYEHISLCVHMF